MPLRLAARLAVFALLVAGCGSAATPAPPAAQPSTAPMASVTASAQPSVTATAPPSLVPGNSVVAPLPTDAPAAVRALSPLPSCGAEVLFEQDVDISPIPTAPGPTTDPAANKQATGCLMSAWANKAPAELDVTQISDEADEIYSMYRLPGDGTLQLIVRVRSHSDKTITWTQTTCTQLAVDGTNVNPSDCQSETPLS